jgi:hypothetical protein
MRCISEENRKRAVKALLIFTFLQEVLEMAHVFMDTPNHRLVIVLCVLTCYAFSVAFHTSSPLHSPAMLSPNPAAPLRLRREMCTQRFVYSDAETQWRYRRNPVSILLLVYGSWKITFRKCPLGYRGEEPLFFAGAEHWVICVWFCSLQ